MAHYETMYIVHPALEAGRLKDLIQSIEKGLIDLDGKMHVTDVWGKKKLAYPINKEKYGMYILIQFEADGSKNKEFNLSLDHNSNILTYLTTKINEDQLLSDIESLDKQLGLLQTPAKSESSIQKNDNTDKEPEVDSSAKSDTAEEASPNEASDANKNEEEN